MTTVAATWDSVALAELLRGLTSLQEELTTVLESKLDAMRRADTPAMQSATAHERRLLDRLTQLDIERHAIVARAAEALGLPDRAGLTVRRVAESCGEPDRSRLLVLAEGLRQKMLRVAELNRVIALVTGEMLAHYRTVFTAMARGGEDSGGYSHRGRPQSAAAVRVLDAVG
ncbi:MAG: flagellar protein FlgN [Phycisphaerae bacterium]|nr:flagellar protein FlgN [Phycisphaerae bacterium]